MTIDKLCMTDYVGPVWPGKTRAQTCGEGLGTRLLYSSGLVPRLMYNWNEAKLTFLVASYHGGMR